MVDIDDTCKYIRGLQMHPQYNELVSHLTRYLQSDADVLEVFHPETELALVFYRDMDFSVSVVRPTVPHLRLELSTDNAEGIRAAERMGLNLVHQRSKYGNILREWFRCTPTFSTPQEGAELCLRVLREVYGVSDEDWLFITDLSEPDAWPIPLPKPPVWPPV